MSRHQVGDKVYVHMPGLTHHARVGVLIAFMSKTVGKVRFGDRTEVLFPLSKLR